MPRIADILELPLGTVKSRLNQALRTLHADLKEEPLVLSLPEAHPSELP